MEERGWRPRRISIVKPERIQGEGRLYRRAVPSPPHLQVYFSRWVMFRVYILIDSFICIRICMSLLICPFLMDVRAPLGQGWLYYTPLS